MFLCIAEAIALCKEAFAQVKELRGVNERLIGENKSLCERVNDHNTLYEDIP